MRNPSIHTAPDPVLSASRSHARARPASADPLRQQKSTVETKKLFPTQNQMREEVRAVIVGLLNACLIDAIDLTLQAHVAHWNVKGPHFLPLHQLFDKLHHQGDEWVDLLAERAAQLGGISEANLGTIAERTHLPEYSTAITAGHEHCQMLATSLAVFTRNIRMAIDTTVKAADPGTTDLLTKISREGEMLLWMLEAQYQSSM